MVTSFASCLNEISIGTYSESSEFSDFGSVNYVNNTLRVAYSSFSGCFNPFFAETANDKDVVALTHVPLLTFDNEGGIVNDAIDGYETTINGDSIVFKGIADIDIIENDNGGCICKIRLRDDVKFSDGNVLDIDDLIFTMYVLCDKSYDGPSDFDTLPIEGLDDYLKNRAEYISGINRVDNYTVEIQMLYMSPGIFNSLSIYIAPLHYYGDIALYDYQNRKFGFIKGDVSSIKEKAPANIGIGAYIFDSYENGIVELHSNPQYFRGAPDIRYIELKQVNKEDMLTGLVNGDFDICQPDFTSSTIEYIKNINGGTLNGDAIHTFLSNYNGYTYIGINAANVKVGSYKDSYESKCLRKAFATVFSFYREAACEEYYGSTASVINYPVSDISWVAPKVSDIGYEVAFSKRLDGTPIYTEDMDVQQRYEAMLSVSIEYFTAAGFVYDTEANAFILTPVGAKLEYDVMIPKNYATYKIFEKSASVLLSIGITLNIIEVDDVNIMWNSIDNGECEFWSAAWNTTFNHDLYQVYYSFNVDENAGSAGTNDFDIVDSYLDDLIIQTKVETNKDILKSVYFECFDIILDWAVEVPVFQRSKAVLVNLFTVNVSTYPKDSLYSNWFDDIHNLSLNEYTTE